MASSDCGNPLKTLFQHVTSERRVRCRHWTSSLAVSQAGNLPVRLCPKCFRNTFLSLISPTKLFSSFNQVFCYHSLQYFQDLQVLTFLSREQSNLGSQHIWDCSPTLCSALLAPQSALRAVCPSPCYPFSSGNMSSEISSGSNGLY